MPKDTCTRGQIIIMLWKMAGKPAPGSITTTFKDVSTALGENQYKAIMWAYNKGITKGYSDGTFRPANGCKRSEIVTFLYKYHELY